MTAAERPFSWQEANQRALTQRLQTVRAALERHSRRQGEDCTPEPAPALPASPPPASSYGEAGRPPVIDALCALFKLSPFERDVLLLCAGVELEAEFSGLCAAAQGDPQRSYPTFSLALAALPDAHWSALMPSAPLRRHRLIEVGPGTVLTGCPLRIDERILHGLVGLNQWDERLHGVVDPVPLGGALVPSHQAQADRIAAIWRASEAASPVIQLCGPDRSGKRRIGAAVCRQLGLNLGRMPVEALPASPAELDILIQLWDREASLMGSVLLVEADEVEAGDPARGTALARVIERTAGLVLLSTSVRQPMRHRPMVTLDVGNPTLSEQRFLWNQALGSAAGALSGQIEQLAVQFDISDLAIHAAGVEALGRMSQGSGPQEPEAPDDVRASALGQTLWDSCRLAVRPRLDDLAQRLEPAAAWDDLVLPETQHRILRDITAHVRRRGTVYHEWGFASKGERGLGISALFAGPSGTGKTMAAEVLARELRLDLYRIDLSAVVNKYIGETEKNLRRLFDMAEGGGAILLFDEADALFGKRTETKDSHDRYANQEVAYLLQRMESYRGLAILTTNLRSALDTAFLRRLRYVIQFPFPDAVQRAELWRRVFPPDAPTEGLVPERLAQLSIPGGHVRNIALNAAFLAAEAGEPIRMSHVLRAAQSEYAKLEKTLADSEIAGWL